MWMMKVFACVMSACLALLTSGAPRLGNARSAMRLLAWAEAEGGQLLGEVILGKQTLNGRTSMDPAVLSHYHAFLQQMNTDLAELASSATTKRTTHTTMDVVLPPGTSEQNLDFNDILDILGDYTKGFADIVEPVLVAVEPLISKLLGKREADPNSLRQMVDQVLTRIEEMKTIERQ